MVSLLQRSISERTKKIDFKTNLKIDGSLDALLHTKALNVSEIWTNLGIVFGRFMLFDWKSFQPFYPPALFQSTPFQSGAAQTVSNYKQARYNSCRLYVKFDVLNGFRFFVIFVTNIQLMTANNSLLWCRPLSSCATSIGQCPHSRGNPLPEEVAVGESLVRFPNLYFGIQYSGEPD